MCLAVPGKILRMEDRDGTLMSVVDFGGVRKDVCLQYIPDAQVGNTWWYTSVSRSSVSMRSRRCGRWPSSSTSAC